MRTSDARDLQEARVKVVAGKHRDVRRLLNAFTAHGPGPAVRLKDLGHVAEILTYGANAALRIDETKISVVIGDEGTGEKALELAGTSGTTDRVNSPALRRPKVLCSMNMHASNPSSRARSRPMTPLKLAWS